MTCSQEALAAGEPLAGTAPFARSWIVLEQPGPWGRDAVTDSRLPAALRDLLDAAKAAGCGVLLARHPDRPTLDPATDRRHVWVARTAPGGHYLRTGTAADDEIVEWDVTAIAAGSLPAFGASSPSGASFICTHSKRDMCCAVHGRALLAELIAAGVDPARVWECSHVGGHRFSPVMLSLPSGAVHGRVDVAGARAVVDGAIVVDLLRGLSGLPEAAQAATIAVARDEDVDLREVDVLVPVGDRVVPLTPAFATDGTVDLEVRAHDGRTWRVTVGQEPLDVARRESCAKEPVAGTRWVAAPPEPMSPWRQAGGPLVPVLR